MAKLPLPDLNLAGMSMQEIIAVMNKHYGANTLALASKALGLHVKFLSTGIYALDFGLGGGIPENRVTEIHGSYSVLKSTTIYNVIANFQKKYLQGKAFLEDGEKSFDPNYAALCGVDNDRLCIINSDSGEQAVDLIAQLLRVGTPLLIIVDSIASLVPAAELESSMDQQFQGLHPRLVNRMMRIVTAAMKRNLYDATAASTTILATNQIREKTGIVYGNPDTTPGGRGKDFYYSVAIRFRSSPSDRLMKVEKRHGQERNIRYGQKVSFNIAKNKISGSQFEEGEFEYYTRPHDGHAAFSFNNEEVLFRFGVFYGVIVERKSIKNKKEVTIYTYGDIEYASVPHFKKAIVDSPDIGLELYMEIMDAILQEGKLSGVEKTNFKPAVQEDEDIEESSEIVVKKKNRKVFKFK